MRVHNRSRERGRAAASRVVDIRAENGLLLNKWWVIDPAKNEVTLRALVENPEATSNHGLLPSADVVRETDARTIGTPIRICGSFGIPRNNAMTAGSDVIGMRCLAVSGNSVPPSVSPLYGSPVFGIKAPVAGTIPGALAGLKYSGRNDTVFRSAEYCGCMYM